MWLPPQEGFHYNAERLIEKNGYLSPLDARAAHLDTNLRRAA